MYCPHAETEETIVYSSPAVKQIEAENRAFLELVGTQTGYSKGALPLREMWKVFDPLMAEVSSKLVYSTFSLPRILFFSQNPN